MNPYTEKETAKEVNFAEYMLNEHPEECRKDGRLYAKSTMFKGVVFSERGYYDNLLQRSGDGIRFLMEYHNLTFQQAVMDLVAYQNSSCSIDHRIQERNEALRTGTMHLYSSKTFCAPKRDESSSGLTDMIQYLAFRGLQYDSAWNEIVYPTRHRSCTNIVFRSRDCAYAEIRGSIPGVPFKQRQPGSDSDGYWIIGATDPSMIYVCESAIDALSLQQIQRDPNSSAYASIGGCGCKAAVERIRKTYPHAKLIIAFDRDEAGQNAAKAFSDQKLIPVFKDWNEDLIRKQLIPRSPGDGPEKSIR